jgi:D-alanine-D-alanine ligase
MRIGILTADEAYEAARAGLLGGIGHIGHSLERHEKTVHAVREALEDDGHEVVAVPVSRDLIAGLVEARPEMVFNTYFGPARRLDQAHVASIMEYAGMHFTGGDAACHYIGLNKPLSKRIFLQSGLPTPHFFVTDDVADAIRFLETSGLRFPMLAKTSTEGEGIGLDHRSIVRSCEELTDAVERIITVFRQPALVEEFMPGREFTVGVLEGSPPRVLPILEIVLGAEPIYSYSAKTGTIVKGVCPAELPADNAARMGELAVRAGRAIGCRDYWRVDVRFDAHGEPHIMEVNTLPGLQPGYSDMVKMIGPAGMSYAELVREILGSAENRRRV